MKQPLFAMNALRLLALSNICEERVRQDKQWGGRAHDDTHSQQDWLHFIYHQVGVAGAEISVPDPTRHVDDVTAAYRSRLVKVAALALAAIESTDRRTNLQVTPGEQAAADDVFDFVLWLRERYPEVAKQ